MGDNHRHLVIAGPCSLESREQLELIVHQLNNVDMVRIGLWKPRTNPNDFQGIGEIGLEWIREMNRAYNTAFTVEVATPRHVELVLKAGIKTLWIGARTTTSPFAVQEIAEALRGVDIQLMVKNPIHPELKLWLGAFERFDKVGIKNLLAIHRGFYTGFEMKYRNSPLWRLPRQLKQEIPHIPLICDPSHMAGDVKWIEEITLMALKLEYDGFMFEVHPCPKQALSDAKQQLMPIEFKQIVDKLIENRNIEKIEEDSYRLLCLEEEIRQLDQIMSRLLREREQIKRC